ncbi:MAG TPA: ATP synthase subunit I [Cycloclasticus sp.]|nr:ATP synthase subunit I [Cycloclasticus sp.]HIL93115.1 ATP synthase subunit I [Cycloclasticus sp.]
MKAQIKIVGYQLALVLIVATTVEIFKLERFDLKGVLYGGSISIIVAIVMMLRINQAARKVLQGNQQGNLYIYLGAMERLLVSVALFGLGFVWLKLMPLPMITGLIAGQIGFAIGGYKTKD